MNVSDSRSHRAVVVGLALLALAALPCCTAAQSPPRAARPSPPSPPPSPTAPFDARCAAFRSAETCAAERACAWFITEPAHCGYFQPCRADDECPRPLRCVHDSGLPGCPGCDVVAPRCE